MKSILKNIISMLRAKSMSIRDKTNMLKTRFVVLSLLRNKKFSLSSISHKIETILNHKHDNADVAEDDHGKSIVLYDTSVPSSSTATHDQYYEYEDGDDVDLGDSNGSVIDLMRDSKEEGKDFKLEDEIDHAADLFILKFHKRMKLQKLESFKRFQEMLQRGA